MDNISHSLAGLAAGELLHRALPAETDAAAQQTRRRLLLASAALASNFPDLDILLTPLLPEPLGYLLHHRGHTHTLLYALPQALLLAGLIWLLWPAARALLARSGMARRGLWGAIAAGFGLHLAMDYLNSYGLHPFHPVDSRWLYGDMVFIIEPVFWVTLGVPLAAMIRRLWLRALWLLVLAALLVYFAAAGYLHWLSAATLLAIGAALVLVQQRSSRQPGGAGARGVLAGAAVLGVFLLTQGVASRSAAHGLSRMLAGMDPDSVLLDSARTAFPANPLCWLFVSIESNEQQGSYRLRRGVLSLAPQMLPVSACPPVLAERRIQQAHGPALALLSQHEGRLDRLRALQREDCHFEAWMRFARAPRVEAGQVSDMRFSSSPRGDFTTMDLDAMGDQPCPRHVPRWAFPRADLLGKDIGD